MRKCSQDIRHLHFRTEMKERPEGEEFTPLLLWLTLHRFTRPIWIYSRSWYMLGNQPSLFFFFFLSSTHTRVKRSFPFHTSCYRVTVNRVCSSQSVENIRHEMKMQRQGNLSWTFCKRIISADQHIQYVLFNRTNKLSVRTKRCALVFVAANPCVLCLWEKQASWFHMLPVFQPSYANANCLVALATQLVI